MLLQQKLIVGERQGMTYQNKDYLMQDKVEIKEKFEIYIKYWQKQEIIITGQRD